MPDNACKTDCTRKLSLVESEPKSEPTIKGTVVGQPWEVRGRFGVGVFLVFVVLPITAAYLFKAQVLAKQEAPHPGTQGVVVNCTHLSDTPSQTTSQNSQAHACGNAMASTPPPQDLPANPTPVSDDAPTSSVAVADGSDEQDSNGYSTFAVSDRAELEMVKRAVSAVTLESTLMVPRLGFERPRYINDLRRLVSDVSFLKENRQLLGSFAGSNPKLQAAEGLIPRLPEFRKRLAQAEVQ